MVANQVADILRDQHIPLGCLMRVLDARLTEAEAQQRIAAGKMEEPESKAGGGWAPEDTFFIRDDRMYQALMRHYGFLNKTLADFYESRNMSIYGSRDKSKSKVRCDRWAGGTNVRPYSVAPGDRVFTYNSMCMKGSIYLAPPSQAGYLLCSVVSERTAQSKRLCDVINLDISEASAIRP